MQSKRLASRRTTGVLHTWLIFFIGLTLIVPTFTFNRAVAAMPQALEPPTVAEQQQPVRVLSPPPEVAQQPGSTLVCQAATEVDAPGEPATDTFAIYLPLIAAQTGAAAQTSSQAGAAQELPALTSTTTLTATDRSASLKVAYIYASDQSTADAFRATLAITGVDIFPWPQTDIVDGDFSECDMLLVAADTGDWGDAVTHSALVATGLPVAGLGAGGLNFIAATNALSSTTTSSGNGSTVVAASRGLAAYTFPNTITLTADTSIQLYNSITPVVWLEIAEPLPTGAEIGALPGTTSYPLVQINERYTLWGFDGAPATFTDEGLMLFENMLVFQSSGYQVPLAARRFIPAPGIEQALLDDLAATTLPNLHAYVQFYEPPRSAECHNPDTLANAGVQTLSFLWGQTFLASVDQDFDPANPLLNDCIRWMGSILPTDKVAADVQARTFAPWADNGDGTVNLLVQFFPDVPQNEADAILSTSAVNYTLRSDLLWTVTIATDQIETLSQNDRVRWIEQVSPPPAPFNDGARQEMFVDEVQEADISGNSIDYAGLDGSGMAVGIWDGGLDEAHPDFSGRVLTHPGSEPDLDHGTHVAGIAAGSGANSANEGGSQFEWRGMAPNADIAAYTWGISADEAWEAIDTHDIDVSNHSYTATGCGSAYNADDVSLDDLVRGDASYDGNSIPAHTVVWAAGNEGSSGQYCDDEGIIGYHSVFVAAKNVLLVGALNPASDLRLRTSSSRGPTYNGRVKPDVMAIGSMRSTVPGSGYGTKGGTSMAAPAVTGISLLVQQQYGITYGTVNPHPATTKALLINSATDLVNDPNDPSYSAYGWNDPDTGEAVIYHQGPDFATGYGAVHARRTVNAVGQKAAIEGEISNAGQIDEYQIQVLSGREELRFTLAWDDPSGDPALDPAASQIVNDLDLVLIDPNGGIYYPWTLTGLPYDSSFDTDDVDPAFRAADNNNNVEQVTLWQADVDPNDWEGTWTVRVSSSALPEGPQSYSLVGEWRQLTLQNIYPLDGGYHLAPDNLLIPVYVRNPHLGAPGAAGGIDPDDWQVRLGQDDTWTEAPVVAAEGPVGDLVYLVVQPPNTLNPGIFYDLEVLLRSEYQADQRVAEASHDIARAVRTDAIFFLAEERPPVDEMIVMDNSGSMNDDNKLVSAQNAARAFTARRKAGDQIGLARFADNANTLYNLTLVSNSETELDDVKNNINSMTANGATALGLGLLEGKEQIDINGEADHTSHMVLLSDGMENVAPCWDTSAGNVFCEGLESVQPTFVPGNGDCPAISIDTVTVGPDEASWHGLLEDVANKTCGDNWHASVEGAGLGLATTLATAGSFPNSLQNALADIYISIADDNTNQQRLWEEVNTIIPGNIDVHQIELESGLPEATFAVNWPFDIQDDAPITVLLTRPSGDQVNAADPDVQRKTDATHTVYRIDAPEGGTWTLTLRVPAAPNDPTPGREYLAVVSGNTDVAMWLELGLPPAERVVGAEMPIYAFLSDEVGMLTGATVELFIKQPGGTFQTMQLVDDGTSGDSIAGNGVYTGRYTIPTGGIYQVKARAEGTANDGEAFVRYQMKHFYVQDRPEVAYIFDSDKTTAEQNSALLAGNGLNVNLIALPDVPNTDFSRYDLLIIGSDTGEKANWADDETAIGIQNQRLPIIGLGTGAHAFFGKLGLAIGYANGQEDSDASVFAVDPLETLWNQPFDLGPTPNKPVSIYNDEGSRGISLPFNSGLLNVEYLAHSPESPETFWIARERGRYLLWGFNQGADTMTTTGKALFVNAAWYMLP